MEGVAAIRADPAHRRMMMLARRSLLLVSLLMVDGAMARGGTLVLTPTDQEMAQVSFPPYQLAPPFMGYLFTSFNPGPGLYEAGVEYDITPLTLPPQGVG